VDLVECGGIRSADCVRQRRKPPARAGGVPAERDRIAHCAGRQPDACYSPTADRERAAFGSEWCPGTRVEFVVAQTADRAHSARYSTPERDRDRLASVWIYSECDRPCRSLVRTPSRTASLTAQSQ